MLKRLLFFLSKLETKNEFTYSVILVDNDKKKSANSIVTEAKKRLNLKISYFVEPTQNISLARNTSVINAKGDYIAFIDDDEFPPKNWLYSLFREIKRFSVSGVLGPVVPYFEGKTPNWIIKGKFYEKDPKFNTGHVLEYQETRTSNVLIRAEILYDLDSPFDPKFGRGGEDKDFFRRMIEKGHIFKWVSDAYVYESVPYERTKRIFLLKRAILRGKVSASIKQGNSTIIKSFIAVLIYFVLLIPTLMIGHDTFMKISIRLFEHLGKVLGVFGIDLIKENYVM